MAHINILMVGPSRSGKSSILSSMLNATYDTDSALFRNRLTLDGVGKTAKKISDDLNFMQGLSKKETPVLPALTGDPAITEYKFNLLFNDGTEGKSNIDFSFIDIPGEWCDPAHTFFNQVRAWADKCQVMIVAIDTPAFYVAKDLKEKGKPTYWNKITCNTGLTQLINAFSSSIEIDGKDTPKMVVFVPIKCESYLRNDKSKKDLYEDIRKAYDGHLKNLSSKIDNQKQENLKVLIMPVETIGNVYKEEVDWNTDILAFDANKTEQDVKISEDGENVNLFEDYRLINDNDSNERYLARCYNLKNGVVRLFNGKDDYLLTNGDKLIKANVFSNLAAYCYDEGKAIPFYWFKANTQESYSPKNCDQLFMEILKFNLQNTAIKSNTTTQKLIKRTFWEWLKEGLGIFNKNQLKAICRTLSNMKAQQQFKNDYRELYNSLDDDLHKNMQL